MSAIIVFAIVIMGFNLLMRLFARTRRGPRGRMGGRSPGFGQWQQGDGAQGYDSRGNPIEPSSGQPSSGQPGHGGHHGGTGGHHGGSGGGHHH